MLSSYQLMIADFYNIPICTIKKFVPYFFDEEKYVLYYKNLHLFENLLYLRLRLKLKNIRIRIRIGVLEFDQLQWQKPYVEFNKSKRIEADKHGYKDRKALYKLINNAVYGKTMENVRDRTDVKLASKKKTI